jgi:hypothetical protein
MTHQPQFSVSVNNKSHVVFTTAELAYDYAIANSNKGICKVYVENMFKHDSWIFQYAV